MLEIVREYARTKLDDATLNAASARHADFYRAVAETAFAGLRGSGQRAMIAQLDLDADDIAGALDWLLAKGRWIDVADICWSLWLYYWLRNSVTEGRRWTRGVLEADTPLPPLQRGRLLAADAFLATWRRDYVVADEELREAQSIAEQTGDDDLRILTSIMLIVVFGALGEAERARTVADDAIRLSRSRGDRWSECVARVGVGWLNAAVDALAGREAEFGEMLAAATETSDPLWLALAQDNMAELLLWQGRTAEAASLIVKSLAALTDLRMAYAGVGTLHTAAALLTLVGDWFEAIRMQSAADAVTDDMNTELWPLWLPRRERILRGGRERLGEVEYERARSAGCDWSFEEAAAAAIQVLAAYSDDGR
jgi:hypothetical protein